MRWIIFALTILSLLSSVVFADEYDGARYSAWKSSLQPAERGTKTAFIHNDYIGVQVEENTTDVDYGRFNIGTYPDNDCLTYYYPSSPWSSWVIVRVDGESYVSPGGGPSCTYMNPLAPGFTEMTWPTNTDSNYFYGGYEIPGMNIDVYQWLQPVYLEYPTYTTGTVFIKYIIINNDDVCHNIGALLQLDTDIADNDAAALSTILGYSGIEEDFWNIDTIPFPCYWYAYEDITDPDALVALGIMCGYDAVPPSRFAVGSWPTFYNVDWDLAPSHSPYGDSSVLLWWYPEEICPGETLLVATYFGLGEPLSGELILNIPVFPSIENCEYTENPFEVLATFTNGTGVALSDPMATIVLPEGLAVDTGYSATEPFTTTLLSPGEVGNASWNIRIDTEHPPTEHDSICVYVTSVSIDTVFSVCRDFWLPEIIAPYGEIGNPFDDAVSACNDQQLTMFFDSPNDIDSFLFAVDDDTFDLSDSRIEIVGDSLVFTPSVNWANNTYHTWGIVYARDTIGCDLEDVFGNFFVDIAPPVASDEDPADGSVLGTTDFGDITLQIIDNEREVNPATITFEVNGTEYTIDDSCLTFAGNILTFSPNLAGLTFDDGDTICCSLTDVADADVDYCEPNHIEEPYEWCFSINIVDIWLPDTTGCPSDVVDIPVTVEDITGMGITSFDISVRYFPSVLMPVDIIETGALTSGWGDLTMDTSEYGVVEITGSGSDLVGQGALFYIRCVVGDHLGTYSTLTFEDASFNDGSLGAKTTDGFFTTCWEPSVWSSTMYFWTKNLPMASLTFGAAEGATNGYDSTIDLIGPPPSPGDLNAWFPIDDPEHPAVDRLERDFRSSDDTSITWQAYSTYIGDTVFVYWNPTGLPDGMLTLTYSTDYGNITLDMHSDTTFFFLDSTAITINFLRTELHRDTMYLCPGWNMLSLPILPTGDMLIREIVPGAITDGFWYNPVYSAYDVLMGPAVGKAFWVFALDSATINMAGMDVPSVNVHLWAGWNMVGTPASDDGYFLIDSLSTIPAGAILADNIYWYNTCEASGYNLANDTLFVGIGYWVFAMNECELSFGGDGTLLKKNTAEPAMQFDILAGDTKLTIALDKNASSGIDAMDEVLPPLPPDEANKSSAFICGDYRLNRDAKPGGEFTIETQPGTKFSWDENSIPQGYLFTIADGNAAVDMSSQNDVIAQNAELKITVSSLPEKVSLLPNKPNPFNATTEIQFTLPASQEVIVELYDISGSLVRTLFSGAAHSGLNTLVWNGRDNSGKFVSSGVYFVRLRTKTLSLKRKITLIK